MAFLGIILLIGGLALVLINVISFGEIVHKNRTWDFIKTDISAQWNIGGGVAGVIMTTIGTIVCAISIGNLD